MQPYLTAKSKGEDTVTTAGECGTLARIGGLQENVMVRTIHSVQTIFTGDLAKCSEAQHNSDLKKHPNGLSWSGN